MGYTYEHLNENERRRIERLLTKKETIRGIARTLGRSVSTICEEIKHNSVQGVYTALKAHHKADVRRKASKRQCMKVLSSKSMHDYVLSALRAGWSPELIAGRITKREKQFTSIGKNAIYTFVYSVYGRQVEQYLYSNQVKRLGGSSRGKKVVADGRVSIEKRPFYIQKRVQFGHFEGDFIVSGKDGKGALLVLVERKTRYVFLAYCEDRSTKAVNALIARMLKGVTVRSLTLDNDISFQKHEELSALLESIIYFTRPYTSSDKGCVENRNRVVRRTLPKKTDFSLVSEDTIRKIECEMRTRPMKCLDFYTPEEVWTREMKKINAKEKATTSVVSLRVLKANTRCSA
jgi:IS30 family transposase